ncbi:MAG: HD domain-containing protein, partial [Candidatus Krumholzibacteria bacterium]|nr:HD domain-containing protein [Candidatus Krumholzibacteria bacterium]
PVEAPKEPAAGPAAEAEPGKAAQSTTKKKDSPGERPPPRPARTRKKQEQAEVLEAASALDADEEAEDAKQPASAAPATAKPGDGNAGPASDKKLKRRLLRYRSLFSLTADFGQIREKSRLLEAFLLTTISQTGSESAAFLELTGGSFRLTAWKGFETAVPGAFTLNLQDVDHKEWLRAPRVRETSECPVSDAAREKITGWGMPYTAPFIVHGKLEGLVILGSPMGDGLGEAACEFLIMLIDQTAIAYRNSQQLEQENDRTAGIVQSLMAMIGDHTLSRGDMETIVNYVHAVAVAMNYPEEHIHDLLHGTMLRDVGMVRVSDLIVQSDHELKDEEWNAIKQHPVEGSDMLRKMSFSEHTCDVVLYHHERFNGGGYPQGVRGTQIPLGARIVSVVESYAVMLQKRPKRPALSSEQSLSTLKENLGKRYDPDIIATFVEIVEEEIRTGRKARLKSGELLGAKG